MAHSKYQLTCLECSYTSADFQSWFKSNQHCPQCGSPQSWANYFNGYKGLKALTSTDVHPRSMWHYFDYLPLNSGDNIVSFFEGTVPVQRWHFLERFAKEVFGTDCRVHVHRYDLNPATGTFKDLAGTVAASVLKENAIKNYVVASTGNIANAYARYLASAGINVQAFIPQNSSLYMEAGIAAYGQKVNRVKGDYDRAKAVAAQFAKEHSYQIASGNFDPMRIEAKKTMVYEWIRQINTLPTVYIQALSGGTGPLGIQKAISEFEEAGLQTVMPRQILIQSDKCNPMAQAWDQAKKNNFPDGWEKEYPIIKNPETLIPTLSTGNPKTYPVLAQFVKQSKGEILTCREERTRDVARLVAAEATVLAGPAATISVAGFFRALKNKHIVNGDHVVINLGEGISRSSDFVEMIHDPVTAVKEAADCAPFDRNKQKEKIWQKVADLFS